jgi:hypothetical protein
VRARNSRQRNGAKPVKLPNRSLFNFRKIISSLHPPARDKSKLST